MSKAKNGNSAHPTRVRITVQDVDGRKYDGLATVQLIDESSNTTSLERVKGRTYYEAMVPPGTYQVNVSADNLTVPDQKLEVGTEKITLSVYLGERGWPYYRYGKHVVPFAPPGNVIAVAFTKRPPDKETRERLVSRLTEELSLERCPLSKAQQEQQGNAVRRRGGQEKGPENTYVVGEGGIWLFRLSDTPTPQQQEQVLQTIRQMIKRGRVGIPVDLNQNQVTVMDNQFLVRFKEDVERNRIDTLIEKEGGKILRSNFVQASNTYLIELSGVDYRENLATIDNWYEQGLLVYGEPNLITEIIDDQFPQSDPDDPTYPDQNNLNLQRIDEAWQILNQVEEDLTLGNPEIYVASLDRGVQIDHPDVNDNLTDGTSQIANCFDFRNMRSCSDPDYAPSTNHGMGVYGIIAAHTNNGEAIAGIAPNTHQIGLERLLNLDSVDYADILLWAAGFTTNNTDPDWPDEPLNPGADIINCSHGRNGLALSGFMDDTFQTLTDEGRDGHGTIVVYSTGNDNPAEVITGYRTWAAHPRTIAVGNSSQPDSAGVETKVNSSNYGPEIDVCAQGQGAPSLDDNSGERNFGGTSAAAPTVSAVAALLLSLFPTLTWDGVRDILRNTAVKIDQDNSDPEGRWEDSDGRTSSDPNYSGPHFSQWYGYGRIDAKEALSAFTGCVGAVVNFFKKLFGIK